MTIKVINAGNCMLCGREIMIAVSQSNNKFPDIFFCPECEKIRLFRYALVKKAELQTDKEVK